ncbi:tetratricopeptide repeat protein [Candidatus Peregrinibacteria bacterium]|nr:tetratricopeptide repeat protein [Candidatus Peregrinibacteria bacterium]
MKLPPRILAPMLLAFLCAGALMVFLWWQLKESTRLIRPTTFETSGLLGGPAAPVTDTISGDEDASLLHLRRGDILAQRGEWPEAQEEYEKSVEADGGLPALRKLAQAQLQRRDIKGVRGTLKKLKAEGARAEDVLLLEIIILLRTGEIVDARNILLGAEDSPQKHYGLALLGIIEGNHAAVTKELELTIGGWDPVLRSYARTLQAAYVEFSLFPEGSPLHLTTLLARALAQVQECEIALPLLVQVTGAKDDYRDAWIVQGYCELTTERPDQALASLEHAYALDPQKPEIQYFLARAYAGLYEYDNAITFLEYALSNGFEPKNEVRRLIAKNALKVGKPELALKAYAEATTEPDATLETFESAIGIAVSLKKTDDAVLQAKLAVQKWPDDPRSYDLFASAAMAAGKNEEAKKALEKALELNPRYMPAREKLEKMK